MKYLNIKIFSVLLFALMAFTARAGLLITPTDCGTTYECWMLPPPNSQPNAQDVSTLVGSPVLLSTLYKMDQGEGSDEGSFASSYSTTFENDPDDPEDAHIVWDQVSSTIDCKTGNATCYLTIKDGSQDPFFYVFNLTGIWDGEMSIWMEDFWPNQGAISNVVIYGADCNEACEPPCDPEIEQCGTDPGGLPEPGTLLVLASGLIMLFISRRRKV